MAPIKQTARLAGLVYLLLDMTNAVGYLCVPLVQDNAAAIARMIAASDVRFRLAMVSDLISNVPMSFAITLNDVAAQALLSGGDSMAGFTKPQLDSLARVFANVHIHGVYAVEIFWGLWLFPFGLLVAGSGFLPCILGVLLMIAGTAYVAHSLVSLLLPGRRFAAYEVATMMARGVGELPIMFWLLIKGADLPSTRHDQAHAH